MTDQLVSDAQAVFRPVWEQTHGNDGYVSFELDPLLEDPQLGPPHAQRVARYIELGKHWSRGHVNRMMKVPATPRRHRRLGGTGRRGRDAQRHADFHAPAVSRARNAIWRGAERLADRGKFKSVYSIFVSRVDVYTEQHVPQLSPAAQGMVGIVGAKRIWAENQTILARQKAAARSGDRLCQHGHEEARGSTWKYAAAFAGSDIETNPPATNDAIEKSGRTFQRQIDKLPPAEVLAEIDRKVNVDHLEATLMAEGVKKFADPQKALLAIVERKCAALTTAR